jgi:hypothetical protein
VKQLKPIISLRVDLPVGLFIKVRGMAAAAGVTTEAMVIDILLDALVGEIEPAESGEREP